MRQPRKVDIVRPLFDRSMADIPETKTPTNDPLNALMHIHTLQPRGYVFLGAREGGVGKWIQKAFKNRGEWEAMEEFMADHPATEFDLYFSVSPFSQPERRKKYALASRLAHVDIDEADPFGYAPPASLLWRTSPGRHQGLWVFRETRAPDEVEDVSRHLVYTYGGDKNGWSIDKMLRIPGTYNHKPEYKRPRVKFVKSEFEPIANWPNVTPRQPRALRMFSVDPHKHDAERVIAKYKNKLSGSDRCQMEHRGVISPDRSRAIFMIVVALYEAGATPDEIAAVVWRSVYFVSKYGQLGDKRYDVLDREISRILSKVGGAK